MEDLFKEKKIIFYKKSPEQISGEVKHKETSRNPIALDTSKKLANKAEENPSKKEEIKRQKEINQEKIQELKTKVKTILDEKNNYTIGLVEEIKIIDKNLKQNEAIVAKVKITEENANLKLNKTFEQTSKLNKKFIKLETEKNNNLKEEIEKRKENIKKFDIEKLYKDTRDLFLTKVPKELKAVRIKKFDQKFKTKLKENIKKILKSLNEIIETIDKEFDNEKIEKSLNDFDEKFTKELKTENIAKAKAASSAKKAETKPVKNPRRRSASTNYSRPTSSYTPSRKEVSAPYVKALPKKPQVVSRPASSQKPVATVKTKEKSSDQKFDKEKIINNYLDRKYTYDEVQIVSDSTLVKVGKLFAKAAEKNENHFNKLDYTKGAKRLTKTRINEKYKNKNNRHEAAIKALNEKNCKLLILSAGINDIQDYIFQKNSSVNVIEHLKKSFSEIIELAHSKGQKIALFLLHRKGKLKNETPAQTAAIENSISEINKWIKSKDSGVDLVINPEKLPEGSYADNVHFNTKGSQTVLTNIQSEIIA